MTTTGSSTTLLACAVAAAVGATLVGAKMYESNSKKLAAFGSNVGEVRSPNHKIPSELLKSKYAEELKLAVSLALRGM